MERQVGLRRVDFLGCSILAAWLLSPVGGQASLRLLSSEPRVNTFSDTLFYYPIEQYPDQTALPLKPGSNSSSPFFAALFVTAIQTSRHRLTSPTDLFGNVRIPDIHALSTYSAQASNKTWHSIANGTDDTEGRYTSIFGIPIAGLPDSGNASFNLITHYWKVNCTPTDQDSHSNPWRVLSPNETTLTDIKPLSPSFDIVIDEKNSTDTEISFLYQSTSRSRDAMLEGPNFTSIACTASPVVVESKVFCHGKACGVLAMRDVADRGPNNLWSAITPLSVFRAIAARMPGVDISATQDLAYGNELIERWIYNPNLDNNATFPGWIDLPGLEVSYFSQRLQIAINTFWDSTIGSVVRMDSFTELNSVVWKQNWNATDVSVTKYEGLRYVCHIQFAVLTIGISLVLLLAANLSMLLGIVTRTPDILGFVSVLARDNPYFRIYVPSHFSGLEAARVLRDVKVRVGDVKSAAGVGHIALTTMDTKPEPLSWERWYD
ncbi:Nn.00g107150.m01.CDS01 [Neocucurbitaria sp. VM-36]